MAINIVSNETLLNGINETINQTAINVTNPKLLGMTVPITTNPVIDILVISLLVSLFITIVNKYMGDQKKIKALKDEMKILRKKQKEVMKEKNPKKMQEIQQEVMKKSMEQMKHTMNFKIMLVTMLPLFVALAAIRAAYTPFGKILNLGIFGWELGWLGTYILFSIISSLIMKKILNVA